MGGRKRADLERAARERNDPATGDFGVRILNVAPDEKWPDARLAMINGRWMMCRLTPEPCQPLEIP